MLLAISSLLAPLASGSEQDDISLRFVKDTACEITASPLEILALPTADLLGGKSIYMGCIYYILKLQRIHAELKEPVLNYRNVSLAQNIWRIRGQDVLPIQEKRYGYISVLDLAAAQPGDVFLFKYEYLSALSSNIRTSQSSFRIIEFNDAMDSALRARTVQGFCYALFFMNIITFLSFIKTNPRYKYYVGYAASLLIFLESAIGLFPEIIGLPHYRNLFPHWQTVVQLTGAISGILIVFYIDSFFNYKMDSKYISYIFKAFLGFLIISGVSSLIDIDLGHSLTNMSLTAGVVAMIFITFYSTYIKKQMSQLIFLGFIGAMITQVIFLLAITGQLNLGIHLYSIILMGFPMKPCSSPLVQPRSSIPSSPKALKPAFI